ncbi:MAG: ion channel [Chitinophagaceae bacterium]|jgi:hypothetical protein|nr:ion channel [Chitinophagaceae bacterium]
MSKTSRIRSFILNTGAFLLLLTGLTIFVTPVLPLAWQSILFPLGYTGIFVLSALHLQDHRRLHVTMAILLTVVLHLALLAGLEWLSIGSRMFQFLYFLWVVVSLVKQIASSREVNRQVIVSSVTAYFLLGLAMSIMVALLALLVPGSYNFEPLTEHDPNRYRLWQQSTYYTFVTYTTTGYGDLLPTHPLSQSLAIAISGAGQLYIAIIIAMLVGKYTATNS